MKRPAKNPQILSSVTVVNEISRGSKAAFEKVYEQLHVKLYRYLLKQMKSEDGAREVTQLSFIRLWEARHTLKEEYTIETQVFTIARSTLLNYIRKKNQEKKYMAGSVDLSNPETYLLQQQTGASGQPAFDAQNYWQKAIEVLPPAQRKVFLLSRIYGLTNKEIAAKLSISVKTVEEHISKAIRKLRSVGSLMLLIGCVPILI